MPDEASQRGQTTSSNSKSGFNFAIKIPLNKAVPRFSKRHPEPCPELVSRAFQGLSLRDSESILSQAQHKVQNDYVRGSFFLKQKVSPIRSTSQRSGYRVSNPSIVIALERFDFLPEYRKNARIPRIPSLLLDVLRKKPSREDQRSK